MAEVEKVWEAAVQFCRKLICPEGRKREERESGKEGKERKKRWEGGGMKENWWK